MTEILFKVLCDEYEEVARIFFEFKKTGEQIEGTHQIQKWVNNLFEENRQLKMENNELKLLVQNWESLDEEKDEQLDKQNQALKKLKKENEQLKQSNQKLNDELQETMGYLALKSGVEKENEQLKHKLKSLNDNFNHLKRLFDEIEEPISDELLAEYSRIVVEEFE